MGHSSGEIGAIETFYIVFICIFCWCILTPILFYYLYKFYSMRRNAVINKRHYRIVIAINIFIALLIIFKSPFAIIAVISATDRAENCYSSEHIDHHHHCSPFLTIATLVNSITTHGFGPLLFMRGWFIYFETKYCQLSSKGIYIPFFVCNL